MCRTLNHECKNTLSVLIKHMKPGKCHMLDDADVSIYIVYVKKKHHE